MTDTRTKEAPGLNAVLETALYVADIQRAGRFYEDILGLPRLTGDDQRFRAYDVGGRSILLLFLRGSTSAPMALPGGIIPPHDGQGRQHMAFAISKDELPRWEERLSSHGIAVDGQTDWPRGAGSIYVRDPDGHLVEFVTPGAWATY